MAFEHKPGQFSLFKNDKQGNESRPDYWGEGKDLEGRPIRVSAWIKQGKAGKFMSCNFQLKSERSQPKTEAKSPDRGRLQDMDDDLPF